MIHPSVAGLLVHAVRFGVGGAVSMAVGFALLPILTRVFTPEDYAILAGCALLLSVVQSFLGLSLGAALEVHYYDTRDAPRRSGVVSTGLWFALLWAICVFGMTRVPEVQRLASSVVFGSPRYREFVSIALLLGAIQIVVDYLAKLARIQLAPVRHFLVSSSTNVVGPIAGVTAVVGFGAGVLGYYRSIAITAVFVMAITLAVFRNEWRLQFDRTVLRQMLSYSLPLVPATTLIVLNPLVDRFLLLQLASLDEVGLYSVALRFPALIAVATGILSLVFGPYALKLYASNRDEIGPFLRQTLKLVLSVWGAAFVAISLAAAPVFSLVVDRSFFEAHRAVWPISLAQLAAAAAIVTNIGFGLTKRSRAAMMLSFVSFATNVVLNVVLIPLMGITGAGLATALAAWVNVIGGATFTSRHVPGVRFDLRGAGAPLLVVLSGLVGWRLEAMPASRAIAVCAVLLLPLWWLCIRQSGLTLKAVAAFMRSPIQSGPVTPRKVSR